MTHHPSSAIDALAPRQDVARIMLVESDRYETRVAILEDGQLIELFLERHHNRGVVGNIYKGRVSRVLPGIQAAFVDVGLERDAFLYVGEVVDPVARFESLSGNVDVSSEDEAPDTPLPTPLPPIDQLLQPGQELMVQVIKDAMPNKGARISTQITLPGRYLVLLPDVPEVGISRRIDDAAERESMRALLETLRPEHCGLILRTAGAGRGRAELEDDLHELSMLWANTGRRAASLGTPALLHRDLDLGLRVVRDLLDSSYEQLWVDGREAYEAIVAFLRETEPTLVELVHMHENRATLLQRFGVETAINDALKSRVWLKSGGSIIINPTEALVAIDVNTSRNIGRRDLEETILTTNLEAVREIVRQIRLRNLGGIIVIDLIDMTRAEHREKVFAALAFELTKDRAKNKVLNISEFGLVEITRKRSRTSLGRLLTQPCPHCQGRGRVRSLSTLCLEVRRQLLRRRSISREMILRVHPDVAHALLRERSSLLRDIEQELAIDVSVTSDSFLQRERFELFEA